MKNRTMTQSALQFVLQHKEVAVTLAGFNNRKHLKENLSSLSVPSLAHDELDKIYSI